jgi:mRNA interferase RelE/StbE
MAAWRVLLLRPARNYLECLTTQDRRRILDALENLVRDPQGTRIGKLRGRSEFSLHVGGWRVLLVPDKLAQVFVVTRIGPRGDVYK